MSDEIGSAAFRPQNELEVELVRATHEPDYQASFLRELLDSEIYLALVPADGRIEIGPDGQALMPRDARLDLVPVERDGRTILPFFSAPVRANAHVQADHFIAAEKARDLFVRHPGTEFVLNPGSDYSVDLFGSDIAALLKGDFTAH